MACHRVDIFLIGDTFVGLRPFEHFLLGRSTRSQCSDDNAVGGAAAMGCDSDLERMASHEWSSSLARYN